MARKGNKHDRIVEINTQARAEGTTYGKWQAAHYSPPELKPKPKKEQKPDEITMVCYDEQGRLCYPPRPCVICGESFIPHIKSTVTCSTRCWKIWHEQQMRAGRVFVVQEA